MAKANTLGDMPRGMDKRAQTIWKEYAPLLEAMGHVTEADKPLFQTFCESLAMYRWLREQAIDTPIVAGYKGVRILNPLLKAADKEFDKWFAAANKLGLSPESRRKNKIVMPETVEDELAAFVRKGRHHVKN